MLKVENVTKKYGNLVAVNNLSFEVKDGEIFGLLGLNGAGKTTTFRMILGLLDDYSGNITIDGEKINYDITDKIGFLTEERSLLPSKTVYEQAIFYGTLKGMDEVYFDGACDVLEDMISKIQSLKQEHVSTTILDLKEIEELIENVSSELSFY